MESRFSPAYSAILLCSARFGSYMDKRDARRGEDFPRWDDSQEASRMFIPNQGSHWVYLRKIQTEEMQRLGLSLNYLYRTR